MNLRINHTRLSGGLLPLLLALLLLLSSATASASRNEFVRICSLMPELSRTLRDKHISFHYVNDELRQRIVDTYVTRLDSSKSRYLADEIDGLKTSLRGVIQKIRDDDCSELLKIQEEQVRRYEMLEKFAAELLADENYALDTDAVLIIDPDKRSHPHTAEARDELVTR